MDMLKAPLREVVTRFDPTLMADAMAGRTALLPALGDGELAPAAGAWRAFGRSTREAMGLGVRWMIRAAIENLREAVRRELGAKRLPCVRRRPSACERSPRPSTTA